MVHLHVGAGLSETRKRWMTNAILTARCMHQLGFGLLVVSSTNILYKMVGDAVVQENAAKRVARRSGSGNGNGTAKPGVLEGVKEEKAAKQKSRRMRVEQVHRRVQQEQTNHDTAIALGEFVVGPLIGSAMDAYGRLPAMILAPLISGLFRLRLAWKPSLGFYFIYRIVTQVSMQMFMRGSVAMLGDIHGRGTRQYTLVASQVQRYSLLCSVMATYLGRLIPDDCVNIGLCGVLQVGAGLLLAAVGKETLPMQMWKPMSLRASNPLSFISFFGQSKALLALFAFKTMRELPNYVNIHMVYRRQRFEEWGRTQDSNMMVYSQIMLFLSTFSRTHLMDRLGLEACHRLHSWVSIAIVCNNVFAPRHWLLYLNTVGHLLQTGMQSTERLLQMESVLVGAGAGELQSATANMSFLSSLVMPNACTQLYLRCMHTFPEAPYALAAVLHFLNAEVVGKMVYASLSTSTRNAVTANAAGPYTTTTI